MSQQTQSTASIATAFVAPFARVVERDYPLVPRTHDPAFLGERIPVDLAFRTLEQTVDYANAPDLGLRAGRITGIGTCGILGYAMEACETVRDSLELARKYSALFNQALDVGVERVDSMVILCLRSRVPRPRAVADFTVGAWYTNGIRSCNLAPEDMECWFTHTAPADLREYERTISPAKLQFGAPCDGIAFHERHLDARLDGANPYLRAVLLPQLERLAVDLAEPVTVASRVRDIIARELGRELPTAARAAAALRMSQRTFTRRLEEENTSFSQELETMRRALALKYVRESSIPLHLVASLVGFAEPSSFHRAFKRWTDETPLRYRRQRGGTQV